MKWIEHNVISEARSGRRMGYILVVPLVIMWALVASAEQSMDEQAVWKLESAYWNYVKSIQDEITDRVAATLGDNFGVLVRSMVANLEDKPDEQLSANEFVLGGFNGQRERACCSFE